MGISIKNKENAGASRLRPANRNSLEEELSLSERFRQWLLHDSPSWMISALFIRCCCLLSVCSWAER